MLHFQLVILAKIIVLPLSPGSAAARRTEEPAVSVEGGGPARVSTIPPRAPHIAVAAPQPPPLRSRLVTAARRAAPRPGDLRGDA